MKVVICLLFALSLFSQPIDVQISTPHAILINARTGKILYEKKAREEVFPASTTKVAMALCLLKMWPDRLEEIVTCSGATLKKVSEEAKFIKKMPSYVLEWGGTSMELQKQERVRVRDLLCGALIASGNDASNVLAEYFAGDIPTFVQHMNDMAQEMGCLHTHFSNPHGLFYEDHYTCAYDMALFAKEAMRYPVFRNIVKMPGYERVMPSGESQFIKANNLLVRNDSDFYYPLAIGIKTGYVRRAKHNLVAAASNGERELIAVLHASPSKQARYQDAVLLFEAAFCEPRVERLLFGQGETVFRQEVAKAAGKLSAGIRKDLYFSYYPSEEEEIEAKIVWRDLEAPIAQGVVVGELRIFAKEEGRLLLQEDLIAEKDLKKQIGYRLLDGAKAHAIWAILGIMAVGGFLVLVRYRVGQVLLKRVLRVVRL